MLIFLKNCTEFLPALAFGLVSFSPAKATILIPLLSGICLLRLCLVGTEESRFAGTLSILDIAVGLNFLAAVASALVSDYRPNTVGPLGLIAIATLLYFSTARMSSAERATLSIVVGIFVLYLVIPALGNFWFQYTAWRSTGFADLTIFKVYVPLFVGGTPSPVHVVLFLALFVLIVVSTFHLPGWIRAGFFLPGAALLVCVYLSFSRALYAATAGFLLCMFIQYRKQLRASFGLRMALIVGITSLTVTLSSAGLLRPGLQTIALFRTTSQQRSGSGRLQEFARATELIKMHPLLGVGPGNYAINLMATGADENKPLVPQSFNIFTQVAAEEGIFGLAALAFLVFAAWLEMRGAIFSPAQRQLAVVAFSGIASVLFFNCFESSLFSSLQTSGTTWVLFAMLTSKPSEGTAEHRP